MCAQPARKLSPLAKEVQRIKSEVDALTIKMQKDQKFTPTRPQLENCAEELIEYIAKNHGKINGFVSHLKAAIIDLTEVPVMSAQMQRLAFATALKDASHQLDRFLNCL